MAVVSAASFRDEVAPESLATIFTTIFAPGTAHAQLDAAGRLPKQLGGIQVSIDGQAADLIFVSPGQINCVIPIGSGIGDVGVTVTRIVDGSRIAGQAKVRLVAPSIFSLNASGSGTGAIRNAVTSALPPFRAETVENPGIDKVTRLAVYATGLRFAANPDRTSRWVDSSVKIRVQVDTGGGEPVELPVEYAGPAPGFFGLDQVNVAVNPKLAGRGPGRLRILAGSSISNRVDLTVAGEPPPLVFEISPKAVATGQQIRILGSGFQSETERGSLRTRLRVYAQEQAWEWAPAHAESGQIIGNFPPIPGSAGGRYQGPVRLCAVVDEQEACASQSVTVLGAPSPVGPPGQAVLEANAELARYHSAVVADLGGTADLIRLNAQAAASRRLLEKWVSAARANNPARLSVTLPDGANQEVVIDASTLREMDGLLAPTLESWKSMRGGLALSSFRQATAAPNCELPVEREIATARAEHNRASRAAKVVAQGSFLAATLPLVAACATPITCVGAPAVLGGYTIPKMLVAIAVNWVLFENILRIEYGAANSLDNLAISPLQPEVPQFGAQRFIVTGKFSAPPGDGAYVRVITRVLLDAIGIGSSLSRIGAHTTAEKISEWIVREAILSLAKELIDERLKQILTSPGFSRDVELSAASLHFQNQQARVLEINPRCREAIPGELRGLSAGSARVYTWVPDDRFLRSRHADSTLEFLVSVGFAKRPQLHVSDSPVRLGSSFQISGTGFPATSTVVTTVLGPTGSKLTFNHRTDATGYFSFPMVLGNAEPTGQYRISSTVAAYEHEAVKQFSVQGVDAASRPWVSWVQAPGVLYSVGDSFFVRFRTEAGGKGEYDLMLRVTSERTGAHYYIYDDPTDTRSRWLHTAARPLFRGIPLSGEGRFPPAGEVLQIQEDTPSGNFLLTMYFSSLGNNRPVGGFADAPVRFDTPADPAQCFIATAAFGSPLAREVDQFRKLRDLRLSRTGWGNHVLQQYYSKSPALASLIQQSWLLRKLTRILLYPFLFATIIALRLPPGFELMCITAVTLLGWWIFRLARQLPVWAVSGLIAVIFLIA